MQNGQKSYVCCSASDSTEILVDDTYWLKYHHQGVGGWKKLPGNGMQLFLRSQPPEGGGGGYANFFLTHMTKNFTKQSCFKAKKVHVDLLTPSLHQCEDYGPGSTCKAW